MAERSRPRYSRVIVPAIEHPDAIDETVVHDPHGRPWLISTIATHGSPASESGASSLPGADGEELTPDWGYETHVYYTARAGIRGFPTGWGERFVARDTAVQGHRRWCILIRQGEVIPDLPPEDSPW